MTGTAARPGGGRIVTMARAATYRTRARNIPQIGVFWDAQIQTPPDPHGDENAGLCVLTSGTIRTA